MEEAGLLSGMPYLPTNDVQGLSHACRAAKNPSSEIFCLRPPFIRKLPNSGLCHPPRQVSKIDGTGFGIRSCTKNDPRRLQQFVLRTSSLREEIHEQKRSWGWGWGIGEGKERAGVKTDLSLFVSISSYIGPPRRTPNVPSCKLCG